MRRNGRTPWQDVHKFMPGWDREMFVFMVCCLTLGSHWDTGKLFCCISKMVRLKLDKNQFG